MSKLNYVDNTSVDSQQITDITKNIGVSITKYPKLGGEIDDSSRIQRAINANPNTLIKFPDDVYEIGTKIIVTNQVSFFLSKNAIFKATASMDYMIDWDGGSQNIFSEYSMCFIGGVLDGDGISGGLSLANIHHFTHAKTWYKDCTIGLNLGKATDFKSYEGNFQNLYFRNTIGINNSIGIQNLYKGDHHFEDIIIIDYTTGIKNTGYSNRFTRCHIWNTNITPDMS